MMDKLKRLIAFEKVEKVIESCETSLQLLSANNMLHNFRRMYGIDNIYSPALSMTYLEKSQELEYDPAYWNLKYGYWQPCGKAHQQPDNAGYQTEMLEQFEKDKSDRYMDYIGGR